LVKGSGMTGVRRGWVLVALVGLRNGKPS